MSQAALFVSQEDYENFVNTEVAELRSERPSFYCLRCGAEILQYKQISQFTFDILPGCKCRAGYYNENTSRDVLAMFPDYWACNKGR